MQENGCLDGNFFLLDGKWHMDLRGTVHNFVGSIDHLLNTIKDVYTRCMRNTCVYVFNGVVGF